MHSSFGLCWSSSAGSQQREINSRQKHYDPSHMIYPFSINYEYLKQHFLKRGGIGDYSKRKIQSDTIYLEPKTLLFDLKMPLIDSLKESSRAKEKDGQRERANAGILNHSRPRLHQESGADSRFPQMTTDSFTYLQQYTGGARSAMRKYPHVDKRLASSFSKPL